MMRGKRGDQEGREAVQDMGMDTGYVWGITGAERGSEICPNENTNEKYKRKVEG